MQLVKYLILFHCFISIAGAQTQFNLIKNKNGKKIEVTTSNNVSVKDELKSPKETMRTFVHAMDRVKKGDKTAYSDALSTLDLSEVDTAIQNNVGKLTAENLINTLDRTTKIHFDQIPNYEDGATWYFRKQTININDNVHDVEIALHKTAEGWKFTPETVTTIEDYYHSVEKLKVVDGVIALTTWRTVVKNKFPDWTGEVLFLFKNGQWVGLFLAFLFSFMAFFIVRFIANIYIKDNIESENRYKSTLPFGLLASGLVFKFLVKILELDYEILEIIMRADYIFNAIIAVWASLKVVDYISFRFEKSARLSSNKFDDVLVPMLKKTAKVVVIAFGGLLIAHSLTFDVASILAGLGIGGVAVALAAKDTISNLFGSVTVILDRPFNIGDYIVLEKGVEGTVEQVGFRSTRIRTPINSLITMPNSVLANMAIDNYGMRSYRRFRTFLQVEYSTSNDLIEEFVENVRYLLNINGMIEKNEVPAQVYVHDLGESSINILLNVYFLAPTAKTELEERHKLILEIIKIANKLGVSFAYPTRTLLMNKEL